MSLRLEVVAATERGLIRERNEDSVGVACDLLSDGELRAWSLVVGNEPTILVIADGVGGHRGGHLASRYAVGAALRKGADLANAGSVASILEHISNEIRLEYLGDLGNRGCSTTIVGITVDDKIIRAFNVGDSRAYIVEKAQLHQVSIDDVLAKPNFGDIPMREQVRSHTITQWLGGRRGRQIDPHAIDFPATPGECFLLCSDGLYGSVTEDRIHELITSQDRKSAARSLIAAAIRAGGEDNISLIICDVTDRI